jgi:2-methylisocitrate lyase-like PEP mutase family enzyme
MNKDAVLKELLTSGKTLIMPNAYDPISAKIIEYVGFSAIQCSGYSYSISKGYKSEDDIDLKTNLAITKEIVDSVNIPVMADGKDGYGEGDYFISTIKQFINIGVCGINIEDQNHKSYSTTLQIVNENIMLDKLKIVAKIKNELRKNSFIINSRTDALLTIPNRKESQVIAIERANKYLEAGADICFVAYVKTLDEVKLFSKEINGPISIAVGLPYNIQEFSINDCIELGIARVSLPTLMILNSVGYMIKKLTEIKDTGNFFELINDNSFLSNGDLLQKILNNKK